MHEPVWPPDRQEWHTRHGDVVKVAQHTEAACGIVFMNGVKRYGIPFYEENRLRVGLLEATEASLTGISATRG